MRTIAIDIREFAGGRMTGIGRFLENIIKGCFSCNKDFRFLLLGDSLTQIPFPLPENCVFLKTSFSNTLFFDQIYIPYAVKKHKADFFLSPYYKRPIFLSAPHMITLHDLTPVFYPENFWRKMMFLFLAKIYLRNSLILTISQNSKKDIISVFKIKPEKIYVIYNHIESEIFYPRNDFSALSNIVPEKYILYVGNFKKHKNVETLIKAYEKLSQNLKKEYALVLVAKGELKKIQENIIHINDAADDVLPLIYAKAGLFVFPSLYEGFGFPPLEAMASKCPVLSSNASCMPEILFSAAEYFSPDAVDELSAKMEYLLNDPNKRAALADAGLKRAAFFSKDDFCSSLSKIFSRGAF